MSFSPVYKDRTLTFPILTLALVASLIALITGAIASNPLSFKAFPNVF
jgi:hypothetical protein